MSKTIFVTQEGPANALALNRENTHVVVAGRNVFKVFSIEEDEFVESINLRVGKNLNLNFSCNDVAWNSVDDHVLATAATNGAVVVWNLNRPSRSKQEYVFSDHKRTVNKVCFNPVEFNWLISGSQDGTMKTFDLRIKEAIKTFISNTESVRDVQFSPHSHISFASVSENGNVQMWDMRKSDKCVMQFTAHSGPVFACDWHPETTWLATASRDKTIKVWDMSSKPTLEYTINTIASVGRVKWRPQNKYHIASVALVVDSSVNVWDIRRPYMAYAAWTHHKDVATGIIWREDPNLCLSTSRDCTLYQHDMKDAISPAATANPQALAISPTGLVAFACKASVTAKPNKAQGLLRRNAGSGSGVGSVGNSGSGGSGGEEFWQASSLLQVYSKSENRETDWLVTCASRYLLAGRPLAEMCDHNANVARQLGRLAVSLLWTMIKTMYTSRPVEYGGHQTPNREDQNSEILEKKKKDTGGNKMNGTLTDDKENKGNKNDDNDDNKSGKRIDDSVGDFFFGDAEMDPLSMDFEINGLDGLISHDWTLSNEAFPLRHEIQDQSPPPEQFPNTDSPDPSEEAVDGSPPVGGLVGGGGSVGVVMSGSGGAKPMGWDCAETVVSALRQHAARGDLQTPVCVLLALGDKRAPLLSHIDPTEQESWLLSYLDLLSRHQLWLHSTQVIRLSWLSCVSELNQQSTTVYTGCGNCNKPLVSQAGWMCPKCSLPSVCSVCHQVVHGLYTWCQGCMHGGHLCHIQEWLKLNTHCPTGCGHICEYT